MTAKIEHLMAGLALVLADPFFTWPMIYFTIFTIFVVGFSLVAFQVARNS